MKKIMKRSLVVLSSMIICSLIGLMIMSTEIVAKETSFDKGIEKVKSFVGFEKPKTSFWQKVANVRLSIKISY